MVSLFTIVCFLFLVMETLIGMVVNGSIILINFIEWMRSRKLSPTDLILICLSLSRLLLQIVVVLTFIYFILINHTVDNILSMLIGIWKFTYVVNLWFAACLGVFYLAKIAIFSQPAFLLVKQRFSGLVPWLLLGSVVFAVVVTVIVMTSWNYAFFTCNAYYSLSSNISNEEMGMSHTCKYITALNYVFDFIPLMIFLSSSTFLISSLWKHMRCVQGNGTGTRDLNTQAHLSAIKALASFAVLYMISFAVVSMEAWPEVWKNHNTWLIMVYNVTAVYPSGHAIILILINPKLKQAWVRILHHLNCCWSKVPF